MYQQGGTIEEALKLIERREYVLPAIQREFVWNPEMKSSGSKFRTSRTCRPALT